MSLDEYVGVMRPAIEEALKKYAEELVPKEYTGLRSMLAYHMGWEGEGAGMEAQGKRIRPLLLLLSLQAAGGNWREGLSAAAAVEFIHNFSLVHDDIEDNSELRRGRPTIWVKWGIPQAINAGDFINTISFLTLKKLKDNTSTEIAYNAELILQETCVRMFQGQYLDLYYETQNDLQIEAYWPMIEGKTSTLLACCAQLGALIAKADPSKQNNFRDFGKLLGLAFQVMDDWLGIWGDPVLTGKPVGSDLLSGKKTLPVLYALKNDDNFEQRWKGAPIQPSEIDEISRWLHDNGAEAYTLQLAEKLTNDSLEQLKKIVEGKNEAATALEELVWLLVRRNK